jgi:hypothetical protein
MLDCKIKHILLITQINFWIGSRKLFSLHWSEELLLCEVGRAYYREGKPKKVILH